MSNPPDIPAATAELIKAVLALIGTAREDPQYLENARAVLGLCKTALEEVQAPQDEARAAAPAPIARVATTGPGNLGLRIAELAADGQGVREIARQLGVNASTVTRRLRKAHAEEVSRNTRRLARRMIR